MGSRQDQIRKKNNHLLLCIKSKKPTAEKLIDVRLCLDQGADVNTIDPDGNTPLHLAVRHEKAIIVKLLLKRGADVNKQNTNGYTALHAAAGSGKTSMVELLLNKGADVNAHATNGSTSLYVAAFLNNSSIVEILLNKGADINAQTIHGFTSLHVAAHLHHTSIVKLLLNNGADVNAQDNNKYTPLHRALSYQETYTVMWDKSGDKIAKAKDKYKHELVYCLQKSSAELLENNGADVIAELNGNSPLHFAAQFELMSIVKLLLNKGADVNTQTKNGYTPLHYAARFGDKSVVELLLNKGAEMNTQVLGRDTPLHLAAHYGKLSTVELLLNIGADVNALGGNGSTPLHRAVSFVETKILKQSKGADVNSQARGNNALLYLKALFGKLSIVKLLLNKGADVNMQCTIGYTPLHRAVTSEMRIRKGADVKSRVENGQPALLEVVCGLQTSMVKLLLNNGAKVNAQTENKETPLHFAVQSGVISVVELLLNKGADVKAKDIHGYTPLHCAARSVDMPVVELLLSKGANVNAETKKRETPLLEVLYFLQTSTVELLQNRGVDVIAQKTNENSSLHFAAQFEFINIVKLLLNKGADVKVQDIHGYTPLHYAACSGDMSIVELVLNNGADVNAQTDNGYTPLHYAARFGQLSVIKLLMNNGADVKVQTENGYTLLHFAARSGEMSVVEVVLSKGADVNEQTTDGYTPLHGAARSGILSVVELLLNKGADVNALKTARHTALHEAVCSKKTSIVELLLNKSADVNTKGKLGRTPLHEAAMSGMTSIVALLLKKGADANAQQGFIDMKLNNALQCNDTTVEDLLLNIDVPKKFSPDTEGYTPLHLAVLSGETLITELLLNNGADINAQIRGEETPFHLAASLGRTSIIDLLLHKGANVNALMERRYTSLHKAVTFGKKSIVELLLNKNADVNAHTSDGDTPLHMAVRCDEMAIVKLLLNRGADVNAHIKGRDTPLHLAVSFGRLAIVEQLLKKGANLNVRTKGDYSLLHVAASLKQATIMELLLNKSADVNTQTSYGYTLLHAAARSGKLAVVELLLSKNVKVNERTIEGITPLHEAARSMETPVVELLLKKGADVNAKATNGYTPLHVVVAELMLNISAPDENAQTTNRNSLLNSAAQFGLTSIVELLLNKGADVNVQTENGNTLLHCAVHFGEKSVVEMLLNKGVDVNVKTENGCTPLHYAARSGQTSVVELLLSKDADVNAQTIDGYTPLHGAVRSGILSNVELLLNKGAIVKAQTLDGLTPLHEAVYSKETSVVELLLNKSADVNAKSEDGRTPLHVAALSGNTSIMKLVLNNGVDVNAQDKFGNTPLHKAVQCKKMSVVEVLLNKGAHVNVTDESGDSPLHEATLFGETSLVELLLKEGADVNAQNENGDTPLHNTAHSGETSIAELLLLKQEINVNALAKNEVTPLHRAVHSGNLSMVELLLNKGAMVNAQNTCGNTPLHEAVRHENAAIASLLVNRGADVTLRNKTEDTPFSYALLFSLEDNPKIVSLLQTAEKEASDALLNNYRSDNPYDIFQTDRQDINTNNSLHNKPFEYLKSTDSFGLPGQLYETKLISLVFIRMLNDELLEHDFFLGVNINNIGDMDDICLRCRVKGQPRPIVVCLQGKHKEDPKTGKLTNRDLWSDSGEFSLRKYFKSYLLIKESKSFHVGNEDPMFEGEFSDVDCYFVLYTPAKESLTKKITKNKVSEIVHNLINTGHTEPFQYSYDEADVDRLAKVAAEARNEKLEAASVSNLYPVESDIKQAKDFFSKLWFYTGQAKEDEVEHIVKYEINKHYNNKKDGNHFKFELHSETIFLIAHHKMQEWWKLKDKKVPYLSRSNDFFALAKLACVADVLLIAYNAMNYLRINVDLEFNQFSKRDTSGTPEALITKLCGLCKINNTDNILNSTGEMEIKSKMVNLLLTNDLDNNDNFKYLKRVGTSEGGGALFKMKMLSLVLLRVLNHDQIDQNPLLGTKIHGVRFLNDICLRYQVKGQQRPVIVFVQLVHREDPEKGQLTDEEVWSDSGNFSLWKYFKSYLEIKDRFWVGNKDPMFEGEFREVDCYFLLCTSAKECFTKKKTEHQLNKVLQDLINTRRDTQPFLYDHEKVDIDSLTNITALNRIEKLGAVFLKCIMSEKYNPNILGNKLIERYHVAIGREVLQACEIQPENKEYRLWQFRSEFFNSKFEYLVTLKKAFVKILLSKRCDQSKITNDYKENEMSEEDRKKLESLEIKLPKTFGNLDMTFRGSENKVRNRMKTVADKVTYLLKLNKDTKMVRINDEDVGSGKTIEQGIIDTNGGIGSAVGNLLVLDADMNMLKFNLENEALPHNAALFLKELKDDRYKPYNEDLSIYRIQININGFPKHSFSGDEYDKDQARDFLNKFWFYPDQAKEDEVERIFRNEINKINSAQQICHNNKYTSISNSISLFSLDEIRKWWMQTTGSSYLSRASELFERAKLADIFNLLQTVVNYMYICDICSIDIKVKQVNEDEKYKQMEHIFKKISGKLLNLFDPQFDEPIDCKYGPSNCELIDKLQLTLKIHPKMESVQLILVAGSENYIKYRIFAKAGAVHKDRNRCCRRAKDEFMVYEQTFSGSECKLFRDCLKDIFL